MAESILLPVPDWGKPPWRVDAEIPPAPAPGRCDVAIVGAGFTGLSAAVHLARRGARVAVFEAASVGAGASGRTGGIVLEGTAAGDLPEADDCIETLRAVVGEIEGDCDLRLDGCREAVHRSHGGGRPGWPDAGKRLCFTRRMPGGTVHPGRLVSDLARAALAAGATIHENAPITAIDPARPAVLRLPERTAQAEHVVLALNAYTANLVSLPVEIHPALTFAVCTAALDERMRQNLGLGDALPFYTVDLPYLWGRSMSDGRLVLGAGLVFPASGDVTEVDLHQAESAAALIRLEERIRSFHPTLSALHVEARWGGPIAFRSDRTPILGRLPAADNVVVAGAYAGHGVAFGVHAGKLIGEAIESGKALPQWGRVGGLRG